MTLRRVVAEEFLREILSDGVVDLETVHRLARARGISPHTLRHVKQRIGVVSVKAGFPAQVVGWRLGVEPTPEAFEAELLSEKREGEALMRAMRKKAKADRTVVVRASAAERLRRRG